MTIAAPPITPAHQLNPGTPVAPEPDRSSLLLAAIKDYGLDPELALKALWRSEDIGVPVSFDLGRLAKQCNQDDTNTKSTDKATQEVKKKALGDRLALTSELVKSSPNLKALSSRIESAIKTGEDPQAAVSTLIAAHLKASDKIAETRNNVFFGFLYLVKMTIKGEITDRLIEAFSKKTVSTDTAREAAFSKAVNQEARTLLASHIFSPLRNETPARVDNMNLSEKAKPIDDIKLSEKARPKFEIFKNMMDTLPAELRNHENWGNVEKRMAAYFNHTIADQGAPLEDLMKRPETNLSALINSMEISCNLDPKTARNIAFQREIYNIGNNTRPGTRNNSQVTGYPESYINRVVQTAKPGQAPEALKPGNQLSLAVDTPLRRENGSIVDVTILSLIGPALDSRTQPEYALYVTSQGDDTVPELKSGAFKKAYSTIRNQALAYARAHPEKTEFALTGVGLNTFLNGLIFLDDKENLNEEVKIEAQKIGAKILAELTIELRKIGRTVVFTDVNEAILDLVNDQLKKLKDSRSAADSDAALTKRIQLAGKIPGDWINPGIVIFNAWDTHSLLGNKLNNDHTIDGFIGRNTLIHPIHALRCAMDAEGISLP